MDNISKFSRYCELTTDFDSVLLPLHDAREAERAPVIQNQAEPSVVNKISRLGLNIYSPAGKVPSYENLLCREMARRGRDYDTHQSVSSFWFSGHPLKQLSPEAITELCFRFSNHFSHSAALKAVRGICATISELNKSTLALLAGLQFNCIELMLDASIAGNDRSLDKLKALAELTADYSQIKLQFRIRIADHTHPDFLSRLLTHVTDTACQQVEVVCAETPTLRLQGETNSTRELLRNILQFFKALHWPGCGNNYFFAPQHPVSVLREQEKLMFTPWGYQSGNTQTLLGLGINGVSLIDGEYQRNCASADVYRKCISENAGLPITRYTVGHRATDLYKSLQTLLCYHQVSRPEQDVNRVLARLIDNGWLQASPSGRDKGLKLSENGLVDLIQVCALLCPTLKNDSYNAGIEPEL